MSESELDLQVYNLKLELVKEKEYFKNAFYKFKREENCAYICSEFIEEETLYKISCECIRKFIFERELKKVQTIRTFKKALSLFRRAENNLLLYDVD
jgi:hypothetical protein